MPGTMVYHSKLSWFHDGPGWNIHAERSRLITLGSTCYLHGICIILSRLLPLDDTTKQSDSCIIDNMSPVTVSSSLSSLARYIINIVTMIGGMIQKKPQVNTYTRCRYSVSHAFTKCQLFAGVAQSRRSIQLHFRLALHLTFSHNCPQSNIRNWKIKTQNMKISSTSQGLQYFVKTND